MKLYDRNPIVVAKVSSCLGILIGRKKATCNFNNSYDSFCSVKVTDM